MKDIMKLAGRLIIITVIAGVLLGLTYSVTKEPIAQQEALVAQAARQEVLPTAADFEPMDMTAYSGSADYAGITEAYIGKDSAGETVGAAISLNVNGFSAGLCLTVGIDAQGLVNGVKITSHGETPGLGAKANDAEYLSQYAQKSAPFTVVKTAPAGDDEIQALTGATITSKAVCGAVNTASAFYADNIMNGGDQQ